MLQNSQSREATTHNLQSREADPISLQSREAITFLCNCRVLAKPLGPGIYGVPAVAGPDLKGDVFHVYHPKECFIGRVNHISAETAKRWVQYIEPPERSAVAGYQPERSCEVVWPLPKHPRTVLAMLQSQCDRTFWYQACDEGIFELSYLVPVSGKTKFDAAVLFKEDLRIANSSAHCKYQNILTQRIVELLLSDSRDMGLVKKLYAAQTLSKSNYHANSVPTDQWRHPPAMYKLAMGSTKSFRAMWRQWLERNPEFALNLFTAARKVHIDAIPCGGGLTPLIQIADDLNQHVRRAWAALSMTERRRVRKEINKKRKQSN